MADQLSWDGLPSYPNWQRKRIQNPCSVSSNLTEGTVNPAMSYPPGFAVADAQPAPSADDEAESLPCASVSLGSAAMAV